MYSSNSHAELIAHMQSEEGGGDSSRPRAHHSNPYHGPRPLQSSQGQRTPQPSHGPPVAHNGMQAAHRSTDDSRDHSIGDEGGRAGYTAGYAASPSYPLGGMPSTAMIRMLQQQITDLRAHNEALQAQIDTQNFVCVQYPVCSWDHIRHHMRMIPKRLMLGLNAERSQMKPSEQHIKDAILAVFDVLVNDMKQRKAFDRAWVKEIRKKVFLYFNNRRGRFSTDARLELWRLLGVPKSINAGPQAMDEWKCTLKPFHADMSWRKEGDDPYGSDAFCGAIGYVKFGRKYTTSTRLRLLPQQLAWFPYVLDLAMRGDINLKYNGYHDSEIQAYEEDIMHERHQIAKIDVVLPGEAEEDVGEALW